MPKFAANLSMMFTEWEFLDRFQAAADQGFTGVEFLFPYDHPADAVAKARQKAGVEQALFNLPPDRWENGERGLAALPGREEAFENALAKALEYAQVIGCPRLHVMAGIPEEGADEGLLAETFTNNLTRAAEAAAPLGIDMLIEPINTRDIPGYYLNYIEDAAAIIAGLEAPNLKLQFDIYHRQIMSGDVSISLATHLPIIGHIQTASVPDRHEPMSGELNDLATFELLDELGYTGWIGCEYRPKAGTVEGLEWMKALG
ncbi:MAG: 2-oxo-tetronate isomerase [Alphaproteobacteria bacterium]|jgi:hydroxypyruvate isomerase